MLVEDKDSKANKFYADDYTKKVIRTILAFAKARQNPVIVGDPGTGKTQTVLALAERIGYSVITVIGSQIDNTDMAGLPTPGTMELDEERGTKIHVTEYSSPWWQAHMLKEKKVIIFFDEFSNTKPEVQASMLQFLQERMMSNGTKIPRETIIIGAMNPSDSAVDYMGISKPMGNRMAWIPWTPSKESWYKGMMAAWGKETSSKEMLWRKRVVDFIKSEPEFLHQEPDLFGVDNSSSDVYGVDLNNSSVREVYQNAWPSRRTWNNVAETLQYAEGDVMIENNIITGLVGYKAASHFREFLRSQESYDPADVLADPAIVDWQNVEVDVANLVIRGIIDFMNSDVSYEKFDSILSVFDHIADEGRPDLAAFAFDDLVSKSPSLSLESKKWKRFNVTYSKYKTYLADSGRARRRKPRT